jgi:serine/alanine racemase
VVFHPTAKENPIISEDHTRSFNGIDLFKFLCAVLVFMIHIPPFQGDVSGFREGFNFYLQQYLCRMAVPFYFVSSGFFLFRKMTPEQLDVPAIKRYCFKLLRLLGTWYILLFIGETGHLWYLRATVVAVVLVSLCFHFRIKSTWLWVIAAILYGIGLLGDSYHGLVAPLANIKLFRHMFNGYSLLFVTTRNGIFMGFIYVLMGAAFANSKKTWKPAAALLGFGISMVCFFAEVFLLDHYSIPIEYNMYIFLLPVTYFLFAFAHSLRLKDHPIYVHLRSVGVLLYFSHLLISAFVNLAATMLNAYWGINIYPYHFTITLLCSVAFSCGVQWLSCKEKFKWISWLLT